MEDLACVEGWTIHEIVEFLKERGVPADRVIVSKFEIIPGTSATGLFPVPNE
jgi:hypothetical protein